MGGLVLSVVITTIVVGVASFMMGNILGYKDGFDDGSSDH